MKTKSFLLVLFGLLLIAIGCKSDDGSTAPPDETLNLTEIIVSSPVTNIILEIQGNSVQLGFTALDQNGDEMTGITPNWESSNTLVATVNSQGFVNLLGTGVVMITASSGDISGNIQLTISNNAFEDITGPGLLFFRNINIVDIEMGNISQSRDVLINEDVIEDISETGTITPPSEAIIIDGTGRYLMPGLSDAHAHVFRQTDFHQYMANSVTSIIDMGRIGDVNPATAPGPSWKQGVINGTVEGPNYYPSVLARGQAPGLVVTNAQEAIDLVNAWNAYDFIKAYDTVPEDALEALVTEGATHDMTVIGHANRILGIATSFEKGQKMIAHAEEYVWAHFVNQSQSEIDAAIAMTLNANAYVTATLSTFEAISMVWGMNQSGYDALKARPGYEFLHPSYKNSWDFQFNNTYNQPGSQQGNFLFQVQFVEDFHNAGIPLLLGTDVPIVGMMPGFSIHEEIRLLQAAGLSTADILRIGTQNFGTFVKDHSRYNTSFGLVREGYRADLVLLDANPLDNLATLRNPLGTMVNGKMYSRTYLQEKLELLRN